MRERMRHALDLRSRLRLRTRARGAGRAVVDASARVRSKLGMPRVITRVAAHDDIQTGDDLHTNFAVSAPAARPRVEQRHATLAEVGAVVDSFIDRLAA